MWEKYNEINLEEGKYYEIGFYDEYGYDKLFKHQGFKEYTRLGFLDNDQYKIEPSPNRFILLNESREPIN